MSDLFKWASDRGDEYPDGIPKDVCVLFEQLAMDVHRLKWQRYSADAILHRIRWHYHVERGDRTFKANNNWTAPLSRWFMKRHPTLDRFFETRTSRHDKEAA